METKYCGTDGVDAVCAITDGDKMIFHYHATLTVHAVMVSSYPPPNVTSFARILYIVCYLKTFISHYVFYTLHVVEPLRYDSVLIEETNERMNE